MYALYTIQMSKRKAFLKEFLDGIFLDSTVKTGIGRYAPTWPMVLGHKDGTVSDEEYTLLYREMMLRSWIYDRTAFVSPVKQAYDSGIPLAVACYCKPGKFCHRHLLVEYLVKGAAAVHGIHPLEVTEYSVGESP